MAKTGYSRVHAAAKLRNNPRLKPLRYRIGQGNRSAICYVPADPSEAA